jgi:spore coat protein A, manganese oxidase
MPNDLRTFQDPLPVPMVLKPHSFGRGGDLYYRLPIRNGRARFHHDLPEADVWGYWGIYPGPTLDVDFRDNVIIEMSNELSGRYRFGAVQIDPKANQVLMMEVTGGTHDSELQLPDLRWTVMHLHGSPTPPASDGWPDDACNPGQFQIYHFPAQPRAALLWYHDHANMITRLNVYAGLAGLYIVRDDTEKALGLPIGPPYEIPIVIQDRNLEIDNDRDIFTGRFLYKSSGSDTFRGPYNVVNGTIWPYLDVQPRQYRFRVLNGSNGRRYRLKLKLPDGTVQIGVDAGFLPMPTRIPNTDPVTHDKKGLLLAAAERADLLIDFSAHAGTNLMLLNEDAAPKVQPILEFRVAAQTPIRSSGLSSNLPTFSPPRSSAAVRRKQIVLMTEQPYHGHSIQKLNGKIFRDRVEEIVELGDTEIWEFINTTADEHPMHIHLVHFQILEREPFTFDRDMFARNIDEWLGADPTARPQVPPGVTLSGQLLQPDENERGPKDTVRSPQNMVTRIIASFGPHTGRYVYHCHILEHEDMEMMRPFLVVPKGLPSMTHGALSGSLTFASSC